MKFTKRKLEDSNLEINGMKSRQNKRHFDTALIRFTLRHPKCDVTDTFWEQTKHFLINRNLGRSRFRRCPLVPKCFVCSQKASVTSHFGFLSAKRMRAESK